MNRICFATNNKHKLREVRSALEPRISIVSLEEIGCFDELPETTDTLEGNAMQKANFVLQNFGIPCFADDTGLEVDALNGQPGVYSARFAGPQRDDEDNIKLLLSRLGNSSNRQAQFRTVIALAGINEAPILFEGVIAGEIIENRKGTDGFGYDPVFKPKGSELTFAEMTLAQKNSMSHRGQAVRKLTDFLLSL